MRRPRKRWKDGLAGRVMEVCALRSIRVSIRMNTEGLCLKVLSYHHIKIVIRLHLLNRLLLPLFSL
jgi:hypothetical protein